MEEMAAILDCKRVKLAFVRNGSRIVPNLSTLNPEVHVRPQVDWRSGDSRFRISPNVSPKESRLDFALL
jgi:hypothetical protein